MKSRLAEWGPDQRQRSTGAATACASNVIVFGLSALPAKGGKDHRELVQCTTASRTVRRGRRNLLYFAGTHYKGDRLDRTHMPVNIRVWWDAGRIDKVLLDVRRLALAKAEGEGQRLDFGSA